MGQLHEMYTFLREKVGMKDFQIVRCTDRLMTLVRDTPTLDIYAFDDFLHSQGGIWKEYERNGYNMQEAIFALYPKETAETIIDYLGV